MHSIELAELIKQLISIQSISGNEAFLITYIAQYLENIGLKPKKVGSNLIFQISGRDSTTSIIFNAHVDTVPLGNLSEWTNPPFGSGSGVIKNGKIYGLGASDEKAGVAALLLLAKALKQKKPAVDVWLTFVVNEEIDGRGTKEVFDHLDKSGLLKKYRKICGVICEPTGLDEIQIAHKGNVFLKLEVTGDAGHGSEPEKIKTFAMKRMINAIEKMEKLGTAWTRQYSDLLLGNPTVSLTSFHAGDVHCPNSFPSQAIATFDIRTIPRMHHKVVKTVKLILKGTGIHVSTIGEPAPAGLTDKNDLLVLIAEKLCPQAKVTVTKGSTDQCFFTERGIPAIIFGPGEIDVVHKPNEWCSPKKIAQCADIYTQLVSQWVNMMHRKEVRS